MTYPKEKPMTYPQDKRPGETRRTVWIVVAAVAAVILVAAAAWGIRVATSDIRGRGDAEVTKNDARNRIRAQEGFEARYQDILATDRKLDVLAADATARPGDPAAQRTIVGVKTYCLTAVAEYNAKARSFRDQEFRDADLPHQINPNNPATDCKENTP